MDTYERVRTLTLALSLLALTVQQAAASQDGPYTMHTSPPVPYEVLNHRLQQQLFHQTVTMPATFGRDLLLERATASDLNGRTLLALETSGGVNGTLYYWGTPKLEQDVKAITIPDLQMTNETKSALDAYKVGYWQTNNCGNGSGRPCASTCPSSGIPASHDAAVAIATGHSAGTP